MKPHSSSDSEREIIVVSATDDGYAMPLAVTIRSALDHLAHDYRLRLYVLDGGLSNANKERLLNSWRNERLTVEWVRPNMELVQDLFVSYQVNVVTYLRLLMARLLPTSVTRAIYIDADMLVLRDLSQLWCEEQGPHAVLAVQDIAAPVIDATLSLPRFADCREFLCAFTPIVNYRELGLPPDAPYFNGGLMVANLEQWRRERYDEQMLGCLRTYREHILWWDQYALNIVLAGQWRGLDYRWNQNAHLFAYPSWRKSPLDRETFVRLRRSPWIVHFCSPSKPWHYFCRHPRAAEWRRCLHQTAWQDWKPEKPEAYYAKLWDFYYQPLRAEWKRRVRNLKKSVRQKYRRAA